LHATPLYRTCDYTRIWLDIALKKYCKISVTGFCKDIKVRIDCFLQQKITARYDEKGLYILRRMENFAKFVPTNEYCWLLLTYSGKAKQTNEFSDESPEVKLCQYP